jgi:tetratricopeptide (TPR) repeat protein
MISAEMAVSQFRRDLTMGALLRGLLIGAAGLALLMNFLPVGHGMDGSLLLVAVGVAWLVLSYRSARGSRIAAESPALIAAGRYEQAEEKIEQSLRSFSIFRAAKMLSLHHLALLRHSQRRWSESAILCRALLGQRLGSLQMLSKPVRLILANALLEMGDVRGAYEALIGLYRQRLSLGEAIHLLAVQLDYESRIGAWQQMFPAGAEAARVQLAELMPGEIGARAQALLALAALKTGRKEWAAWLRRRVEQLADVPELIAQRPLLAELWAGRAVATDAPASGSRGAGSPGPA